MTLNNPPPNTPCISGPYYSYAFIPTALMSGYELSVGEKYVSSLGNTGGTGKF